MSQDERTIQLLKNLSECTDVDLASVFAPGRVCLMLAPGDAGTPQGQLLFSLVVNLMARLHPIVQVLDIVIDTDHYLIGRVPRWSRRTLCAHVRAMLTAISSPVKWRLTDASKLGRPDASEILLVGDMQCDGSVYVGCDGWNVFVSADSPQQIGTDSNPVSINSAACFGVSEVFKRLLARHAKLFPGVPVSPLLGTLVFSTLTYRSGVNWENPPFPQRVDLGRLTMVGLGAGGGATAYTLASMSGLRGHINLIEPDELIESNLNRYVFADAVDARNNHTKTQIVDRFLRSNPDISLNSFSKPFREVVPYLQAEDFKHVSAAVHSREARRDIQYETPSVLWDAAAAEDGEFRIWRCIFAQSECMFCKHPTGEQDPEQQKAKQLAEVLGLSQEYLLDKIRNNGIFTIDDCERIRAYVDRAHKFDLPSANQRIDDWESSQCGKLRLNAVDDDVPIPFSPVMAGVLIAGEIIKEHVFPKFVLDSYYFNTLLGCFMKRLVPHRRRPRADCEFCSDVVFQNQYDSRLQRTINPC